MNVYIGLFLTAFSALALEITLSRLLSVITWYHLAFFAISSAMLGMTAGATRVYLNPSRFEGPNLGMEIARSCIRYALSIPVALILLCMLPLDWRPSVMSPLAFLAVTVFCAVPFYFAGIVISAVITKYRVPMGRLYASDLAGASLGCLLVLAGLEVLDAPSLILLCAAFGILAAMAFAGRQGTTAFHRRTMWLLLLFLVLPFANAYSFRGIRPVFVKGRIEKIEMYLIEKWNSFSRVVVYQGVLAPPYYWGASPIAPTTPVFEFFMNIDGDAGTVMNRFRTLDDIDFLRYDVTTVGYNLDRPGKVCVIGTGGGRDLQSAILFGHEEIVGIDVNPVFINLLQNNFRDFVNVATRPGVRLVIDDARSYLSRTEETFSVIQMSLIDTWAATGAGAFSLTENALYTVEAWKVFLGRLAENGFFTVSRWHNPENIGETGRVISLAVASLLELGAKDPTQHIALITTDRISTLLISRQPFSDADIQALTKACADLQYSIICLPGRAVENEVLARILAARSMAALLSATAGGDLNYEPPTDENPYFFNMLRLRSIGTAFHMRPGVLQGNIIATFTLILLLLCLSILVVLTIVVPLSLRERFHVEVRRPRGAFLAGAVYFSLIGAAFMFLEIAMIQRLSVFLGHPVYALGILLFTLIASTGLGSFFSDKLPLTRAPLIVVFPLVTAAAGVAMRFLLSAILASMITAPIMNKIITSVLVIFPLGMLMGCFFPTGMTMAKSFVASDTPWFWALNGIFGVLCSVLAVFFSIYIGISTNFYVAAACYALSALFLLKMKKAGDAMRPA